MRERERQSEKEKIKRKIMIEGEKERNREIGREGERGRKSQSLASCVSNGLF